MKKRNGTTLVEMLVVFAVGGTLLTLGAGMVHQSMLISRAAASKCDRLHSANRFFEQFRLDIHAASQFRCPSKDSMVIQRKDGSQIAYACENYLIKRTQIRSNGSKQNETLTLDEKAVGILGVREEARIATISIQTAPGLINSQPRLDRSIEAVIGRSIFESASNGGSL